MAGSGIAAGASAGSAFGPWGAAIGGLIGAASDVAGSSSPAGPSSAAPYNLTDLGGFDFSDWTVATSGSKAQGSSDTGVLPNWLMFAGMALAAIVAVRWIKKSK